MKNSARSGSRRYGNDPATRAWIYTFLLPGLSVFLVFYLYPILTVVVTSFSSWDGFNVPRFIGIDNYIKMCTNAHFLQSLRNLILWSLIAMTLHTGYGVVVAFVLRRKLPLWNLAQTLFMVPNVISVAAWAMIYKYFFRNDIGILNSLIRMFNPSFAADWFFEEPWAFWAITLTWLFYAVIVTLLVQGDLLAIPSQLHEAAIIDGASEWQRIWKIDLPLCRNSIGTAIICSITARIAMYESIYLTTNGAGNTMNIPILLVRAIQDSRYGYANAHAAIMLILGVLTLVLINRLFRMDESVY